MVEILVGLLPGWGRVIIGYLGSVYMDKCGLYPTILLEDPTILPEDPTILPEDPTILPEDPTILPEDLTIGLTPYQMV